MTKAEEEKEREREGFTRRELGCRERGERAEAASNQWQMTEERSAVLRPHSLNGGLIVWPRVTRPGTQRVTCQVIANYVLLVHTHEQEEREREREREKKE